ncbi:MAG: putative bifunctional diguanylate cyclase/phosphodiesterase, partial [Wenzhouxiangellaceae bacterium]
LLVAVLDARSAIESMLTGFYMREVMFTGRFGDAGFVIPADARPASVPEQYRQQLGFQLDHGWARFDVEVALRPEKIYEMRSGLPETVLVGGTITSILLVLAALLGMTASRQARVMTDANRQLHNEIRDRELAERELQFLLTHDSLTELPNRKGMLHRIEQAIERVDPSRGLAVLYVDLDQFKDINETLGHHLGDELLRQVPARLLSELDDADAIGRLGGDEFLILLDRRDRYRILRIARALLAAIEQPFRIGEHQLFVTASIGVALLDSRATSAAELIQNADAALFRAKQLGRNQLAVFTPEMFARVEYRLNLSRDIRQALDNEDFRLVYQPIVDLKTLELRGVEALLRWRHTDGNDVPPGDFIRVAEETGMVHRLSRYAVNRAMADLAHWTGEFSDPPWLSVNISGAQFREIGFVQELSVLLHRHKIAPDRLHLEITEEVLIENMTRNRSVLARLDEIGMPLVVDDFGVGYSSLAYIKNFPVSTIKIDQGFIRGLENYAEDQAITRTICALSRDLRLKTVAEGIEELAQLQLLRQYGCDFGQGYLFMRPAPAEEICELLSGEPPWRKLAMRLESRPGIELAD